MSFKLNQHYFLLHLMVLIYGFTGIIGALVSTSPWVLIWYRTALAAVAIWIYGLFKKQSFFVSSKILLKLLGIGLIIAAHWVSFYEAIKVSNVSVTLSCFATGSFFAALIEPIIFRRELRFLELFWGVLVFLGVALIFSIQTQFLMGILLSVFSAFLSALFTVLNGTFAGKVPSTVVSVYEMLGGFLGITIVFLLSGNLNTHFLHVTPNDWWLIIVLSLVCTAFTFVLGINIMQRLSPYTVVLAINLEPVYSIILAHFILNEGKNLNAGFYLGSLVILFAVFAETLSKPK